MQDINIYHLLSFYAKKWPVILLLTILGAAAGYAYNTYVQVPLYKSDATLLIVSSEDRKVGQDSTLLNNYVQLLKSRRVLEPVISEQGHTISYDELASSTTATNEKNTEVIRLSIASKDAETSKKLVDGVIASFKDEVKELYNRSNISTVDSASMPSQPYNVRTWTLVVITAVAGLVLSLVSLLFTYELNLAKKKFTTRKSVKATGTTSAKKAKTVSKPKKTTPLNVTAKSTKTKPVVQTKPATKKRTTTKATKTSTRTTSVKRKK